MFRPADVIYIDYICRYQKKYENLVFIIIMPFTCYKSVSSLILSGQESEFSNPNCVKKITFLKLTVARLSFASKISALQFFTKWPFTAGTILKQLSNVKVNEASISLKSYVIEVTTETCKPFKLSSWVYSACSWELDQ